MRTRLVAGVVCCVVAGVAFFAFGRSDGGKHSSVPAAAAPSSTVDQNARLRALEHAAETDLRNALTAEKAVYADHVKYSDDVATLKNLDPSLDWDGRLKVVTGEAGQVVCIDEGAMSIADIASGPNAGTYFGHVVCPRPLGADAVSIFAASWDAPEPAAQKSDRALESDLRDALTTEKVFYTDNEKYTEDVATLEQIERRLDWGGALKLSVTPDKQGVCTAETGLASTLSIVDIATGPDAGTYFGRDACRQPFDMNNLRASW
jgi:hypothetical protein